MEFTEHCRSKGALVYQIIVLEKIRSDSDDLNMGLHKSLSKNTITDTFQSKGNTPQIIQKKSTCNLVVFVVGDIWANGFLTVLTGEIIS